MLLIAVALLFGIASAGLAGTATPGPSSRAGGDYATLDAPTLDVTRDISGVAPHANIISYKGCQSTLPGFECLTTDTAAAIDQATADEVDVINYSIGGPSSNPWSDPDAQAFLGAVEAGVFPSVSAGNSGPGAGTIGSPADAPWVTGVGAATHNRKFFNALIDMDADNPGDNPIPADMEGKSITCGYPDGDDEGCTSGGPDDGTASIVWAGSYASDPEGDCGAGAADPATGESADDPFPSSVDFDGAIVVCIRGVYGRVAKGGEVAENGAGGMVLINDEASGDSITADPHVLPAVHLTYDQGQALLDWLLGADNSDPADGDVGDPGDTPAAVNPVGAILGTTLLEDNTFGDHTAGFSSRGENPALPDILKPDVTAPGVDIFAAWMDLDSDDETDEYNVISGTSMSAPHTAGAGALMTALHPDWTPDMIRSALMTTAFNRLPDNDGPEVHDVLKEDGTTQADPFDMGAGRVDLSRASAAGFVLDETAANYELLDPSEAGNPTALNIASLADATCGEDCAFARTITSVADEPVTWTVSAEIDAPAGITVMPSPSFILAPGAEQEITVEIDMPADEFRWYFGQVTFTPNISTVPTAHFPVAVRPDPEVFPTVQLHFHGNVHDSGTGGRGTCTGNAPADYPTCHSFLSEDPVDSSPAAKWSCAEPCIILGGSHGETIHDPNWIWDLTGTDHADPVYLKGPMTIGWWSSCSTCGDAAGASANWTLRLYIDGGVPNPEFEGEFLPNWEQLISATPPLPAQAAFLQRTVILPELPGAANKIVLHLEPLFIDSQAATLIYYDSSQGCLGPTGSVAGPCDSWVKMPVVDPPTLAVASTAAEIGESPSGRYVVQLDADPLALYEGGVTGLAATATSVTGDANLDVDTVESQAYLAYLTTHQNSIVSSIETALARDVDVIHRYRYAYSGLAIEMSAEEAAQVSGLAGVRNVVADELIEVSTDVGPDWIDADAIWGEALTEIDGECDLGTCGEGVVVGIIDTGVNPAHSSFADIGGDGYDHTNPRGEFFGHCALPSPVGDPSMCNDKLIGMYDCIVVGTATGNCLGTSPVDDNGHGSHTASTAAGNISRQEPQQQPTPTPIVTPTPTMTVVPTATPTGAPTDAPTEAPTEAPTDGAPSPTATDPPPPQTASPSPTARFIPNTAFEWAIGTPEGLVTSTSLLILLGSAALLAAPRARQWLKSRR